VIDRPAPVTGPRHAADEALDLARGRTARITKHGGYVLYLRQEGHLTGTNAACLATKARRGGHDLLSRGLARAAGPHRHAGPLAGPAHLGTAGR